MVAMPDGPLETAANWKGSELQESTEWLYQLTESDVDELQVALQKVKDRGLALHEVSQRNFELPALGPVLRDIAGELQDGRGFALLRGFPTKGFSLDDIRLMYLAVSSYIGIPIAQHSNGELLGDVRDDGKGYQDVVRGYKSNSELRYHSDSPDAVGLFCVKPAKEGGISKIVSAVKIHNMLMEERPDILQELYEKPIYYSWRQQGPAGQLPYFWGRIFSWYEGRFASRWGGTHQVLLAQEDYPDMPRLTPLQIEGIKLMDEMTDRDGVALDMQFQEGDIQYLYNVSTWHSRTAFEDFDDPDLRRYLLRIWLNYYQQRPTSPALGNRYDMIGETTLPRRRLFDVAVHDTW